MSCADAGNGRRPPSSRRYTCVPTEPSCADGGCPVPDAICADAQTPTVTVGREGADGGRTCADGAGPSADGVCPIFPRLYNDSRTHFYTAWNSGTRKGCTNMICPGFHKTSSSISPGDVISSVSHVHGKKSYMRLRVFKKNSDWHVHLHGVNGDPKLVGYFPKSLVPGLIDKNVEISFGGYVSHEKQQPSPPMGSGYVQASGYAASVSSLKLIDIDGNDHIVDKDLASYVDAKCCYTPSHIDPSARFFYGGPGCVDSLCSIPHM
ncbi:protein neprosin-like [Lolium perenne]|uniref:protein neprosin-like n=1 Tax=Lolium perenne TaxID=4522 RepID=UPI003A99E706